MVHGQNEVGSGTPSQRETRLVIDFDLDTQRRIQGWLSGISPPSPGSVKSMASRGFSTAGQPGPPGKNSIYDTPLQKCGLVYNYNNIVYFKYIQKLTKKRLFF